MYVHVFLQAYVRACMCVCVRACVSLCVLVRVRVLKALLPRGNGRDVLHTGKCKTLSLMSSRKPCVHAVGPFELSIVPFSSSPVDGGSILEGQGRTPLGTQPRYGLSLPPLQL